jgi:hypothetical protein
VTGPPIASRLDHVNVVVPRPRALFELLTEELQIPIERPWARFPAFESGQAMLGIGHEPITYAPGRQTGVPEDGGLFALAFEPASIEEARQELSRRRIAHSVPFEFAVTYADDPRAHALDERVDGGRRRRRWTLITIGGLLGDDDSARELSRWPRRGDGRGAGMLGSVIGWLGSGRLGGVLMAKLGSVRPFVFLCSFKSFDVAESRRVSATELERRGGGPLGLLRTEEIVVSARDLGREHERWQRLLDPVHSDESGRWDLGEGPGLRLVEGTKDAIRSIVWRVSSLSDAAGWLKRRDWLGEVEGDRVQLAREPLQGLDIRLEAHDA